MNISANTQSVLLLTARFSSAEDRDLRPLTPTEWGRFASWLNEQGLVPKDLLSQGIQDLLAEWQDERISLERIERLLERGSALAFALDKWLRAGIWVVTRSDNEYPIRLKKRLGATSPALFFGSGKRALLNKAGVAVVGSRNADDQDLEFSRLLGATAAAQGYSIVSGAARGVDEAAMLGALEAEGIAVGIVADSLLRKAGSPKFRKYLQSGDLSLISPFFPEAGFNVGNAMARNKYIYCLSDAALVVHSGTKGGTWGGAHEAIKKGWVPVWVKETKDKKAGNQKIVNAGARCIPGDISELQVCSLLKGSAGDLDSFDLFSLIRSVEAESQDVGSGAASERVRPEGEMREQVARPSEPVSPPAKTGTAGMPAPSLSLYDLFLCRVEELCRGQARDPDGLAKALKLDSAQVRSWAYKASREGRLKKRLKPLLYELPAPVDPRTAYPTCIPDFGFYELFLVKIHDLFNVKETSAEEAAKMLQIDSRQFNRWVNRAITEGKVKRHTKPVRYEWIAQDSKQLEMFRAEMPQEEDRAEPLG